jgi:hypothetical protein
VLSFRMKNNIVIRSWLRKSNDCESRRRVIVRWPTKAMTTSNKLLQRGISRRGRLIRRRRWHIRRELIQGS